MKRYILLNVLFLGCIFYINAKDLNFPPELLWWINESKKANENISIDSFVLRNTRTETIRKIDNHLLIYPVFMRWNYSANYVAYYNYNYAVLNRQSSGKYTVGSFDVDGLLFIADKSKKIFL